MLQRSPARDITTIVLACLTALVGLTMTANAKGPASAESWNAPAIRWLDVPQGIRESSKTGRPAIMLMQATWCTACAQYRKVWQDAGVVEASKNFVMILVDVDKYPNINGGFSPDGTYVPRTLFITPAGDVLSQFTGKDPKYPHTIDIKDPTELRELMQRAARELGLQKQAEPANDRRAAVD